MKRKLFIILMAMPVFLIGQESICFEYLHVEKDSTFCYETEEITDLLNNYKIIFCKNDSLENNNIVKNCMIQFEDNSGMFISSDIHKDGDDIKTVYIEYGDNKKNVCLKNRNIYPKFFEKMDIILKEMKLTSSNY